MVKATVSVSRATPWQFRIVDRMCVAAAVIGGSAIVLMALTIVVDVISRFFWNAPMAGALDVSTYWWMPIVAAAPMAYTQLRGEHIEITMLVDRLGEQHRRYATMIALGVSAAVVSLAAYITLQAAIVAMGHAEAATIVRWIYIWPTRFALAAALALLAIALVADLFRVLLGFEDRSEPASEDVEEA